MQGQIPSSGAIQFNHFRGTNGSASSSNLVCYGFKFYQTSTTSASSGFTGYMHIFILHIMVQVIQELIGLMFLSLDRFSC